MEMTFEQALRPGMLQAFANRRGSGYMMRSEKRGGSYGNGSNRRPPRRKKAGFIYIFFTLLISLILWPVGMVMLWRRKVRLQAGTKLLISLLTLCLSVFLIVFALMVPVDNPDYTAFQDRANDWLDKAAVDVAAAGDAAYKKSAETFQIMSDFTEASNDYSLITTADAIDQGVEWAGTARDYVVGLFNKDKAEPAGEPTETEAPVEETEAPADTEAPAEETEAPTEAPTEEPTEAPTEEPAPETEAPTEAPTEEPTEAPAEAVASPIEQVEPEVTEEPTPEATEEPAPEITEEPTPEAPAAFAVKPAGEATVYYYEDGSKGFHRGPTRHGMGNAPAHTLAEAFAAGKHSCNSCGMPDETILTEEHVAWVDENNRIHTTDECASFSGEWRLISLAEAVEKGYEACPDCGATAYVESVYPAPTATPEPEVVDPAIALKPAGELTVYYYESSKGYHISPNCVGMSNAPAGTLAEAVALGKHPCGNCNPPAAELVGVPALWLDDNGMCHTSDKCASFTGKVTLVTREDALAQGLTACPDCGAADYLVPGTVLAGN